MVERWDTDKDGPLTEGVMRLKLEGRGYTMCWYTYPGGTTFCDHRQDVDKIDAVLSGKFEMRMNGRTFVLESGDCLLVPKGNLQGAKVLGDENVVSFDATKV